jgi:hypothetical protein
MAGQSNRQTFYLKLSQPPARACRRAHRHVLLGAAISAIGRDCRCDALSSCSVNAVDVTKSPPTILPNIQSQLPSSLYIVLGLHTKRSRTVSGIKQERMMQYIVPELVVIVVSVFLGRATDTASLPSLCLSGCRSKKLYGAVNCMRR